MILVEDKFKALCKIYGKNTVENWRYVNFEEFESKVDSTDLFLTDDNILFDLYFFFPQPSRTIFFNNEEQVVPITLDFYVDYNLKRARIKPFESLYLVKPIKSNYVDCVKEEDLNSLPYVYVFSRKLTDTELELVNHCVKERIAQYVNRVKWYYENYQEHILTYCYWKTKRAYKK